MFREAGLRLLPVFQLFARRRVMRPEPQAIPAEVEAQQYAGDPDDSAVVLHGREPLVASVHQALADDGLTIVAPAKGVKPPVLRHADLLVHVPLAEHIVAVGATGCHFHYEVRRFAVLHRVVAHSPPDGVGVHVKSHHAVGNDVGRRAAGAGDRRRRIVVNRDFPPNQDGRVVLVGVTRRQHAEKHILQVIGRTDLLHILAPWGQFGVWLPMPCRRFLWRLGCSHNASRFPDA